MWIFTKYGFYSVVCGAAESGEADPTIIMIRARSKKHLQNLVERFEHLLSRKNIKVSNDTDYKYRVITTQVIWKWILNDINSEIDYTNFKEKVGESLPTDHSYSTALRQIWGICRNLQK